MGDNGDISSFGSISAPLVRCKEYKVEQRFPFHPVFVMRKQGVPWSSKTSSVVMIWFYKPQAREVGVWLPLYSNQKVHAEELFCSKYPEFVLTLV